jgi:hypothetical protein
MLFVFGAVHMAMFAISKYMANYGAFYGARTAMVHAGLAARQAMTNWQIETLAWLRTTTKTYRGVNRNVVRTTSFVPFGAPIFNMLSPFIYVYANAPLTVDRVQDTGDNQ